MLQDIRKSSQGPVAKVVVGLIIVTFALFGAESIVGSIGGEPEVAIVNGEGIEESKFNRALEGRRRQILSQMGERADPDLIDASLLRSSVLNGLINDEIMMQEADEKGLFVPEEALEEYIRAVEQFKVDGVFSNQRLQMVLRNAGMTLQSYKESLMSQFMIDQSRAGLTASAFVLDAEQSELVAIDRQTRDFGYATVSSSDYVESVTITDANVEAYYSENKSAYKKPENVDVSFIVLDKSDLLSAIEVDEAEVAQLYEVEKESFEGDEERVASHILVKIDQDKEESQALAEITTINERLSAGESFESLAKELSEDDESAKNGGSLGRSGKGVYVSDFEAALFSLKAGETSAPVKTEFGYHLIKVDDIVINEIPEYAEMKGGLELQIKNGLADKKYAELTEQLADITYSSSDLAEASEELSLKVNTLAGVSSLTENEMFSNIKIQRILLSDELVKEKNNSEIIELDDSRSLVFRVDAFHQESILPLVEVANTIRRQLEKNKSAEFAASVGEAFLSRINGGEAPVAVSEDMGLNWVSKKSVKRDDSSIDRGVIKRLFSLKLAHESEDQVAVGFEMTNGGYSILRLSALGDSKDEDVTPVELFSIGSMLSKNFGSADYRNYQDAMFDEAEIEKL